MKIVEFEKFIRMPAGTVFTPYKKSFCSRTLRLCDIEVKVDEGKLYNDRWYFNGVLSLDTDESGKMFIYDGDINDYCEYEKIVIFEPHEIQRMIAALQYALGGCSDDNFVKQYLID